MYHIDGFDIISFTALWTALQYLSVSNHASHTQHLNLSKTFGLQLEQVYTHRKTYIQRIIIVTN